MKKLEKKIHDYHIQTGSSKKTLFGFSEVLYLLKLFFLLFLFTEPFNQDQRFLRLYSLKRGVKRGIDRLQEVLGTFFNDLGSWFLGVTFMIGLVHSRHRAKTIERKDSFFFLPPTSSDADPPPSPLPNSNTLLFQNVDLLSLQMSLTLFTPSPCLV